MAERILIVEDEEKLAGLLRDYLVQEGYEVSLLHRGDEVEAWVRGHPVDLVLLDLMLPYASGYQVLIEARKNAKWLKVPIIVVTARTLEMDAVRALETGANDFVRKPFRPDELIARVRRAIAIGRQRGAA